MPDPEYKKPPGCHSMEQQPLSQFLTCYPSPAEPPANTGGRSVRPAHHSDAAIAGTVFIYSRILAVELFSMEILPET